MENKAMYLHTFSERENGSIFEEPFEGRNLSKLNLCEDGPGSRRRAPGCCGRLGSIAALKYAVVGLYLLVFLILVGVFILAGYQLRVFPLVSTSLKTPSPEPVLQFNLALRSGEMEVYSSQ